MVLIYAIECKATTRVYVGSTKADPAKRMREHRCLLRASAHKCSAMQHDWRDHGESQFRICVLQECPGASLPERREAELKWMHQFASEGRLYNEHFISMQPPEEGRIRGVQNSHLSRGNRWTPEVNMKRRLAQIGIPKGHGAKISATKRARREQVMR